MQERAVERPALKRLGDPDGGEAVEELGRVPAGDLQDRAPGDGCRAREGDLARGDRREPPAACEGHGRGRGRRREGDHAGAGRGLSSRAEGLEGRARQESEGMRSEGRQRRQQLRDDGRQPPPDHISRPDRRCSPVVSPCLSLACPLWPSSRSSRADRRAGVLLGAVASQAVAPAPALRSSYPPPPPLLPLPHSLLPSMAPKSKTDEVKASAERRKVGVKKSASDRRLPVLMVRRGADVRPAFLDAPLCSPADARQGLPDRLQPGLVRRLGRDPRPARLARRRPRGDAVGHQGRRLVVCSVVPRARPARARPARKAQGDGGGQEPARGRLRRRRPAHGRHPDRGRARGRPRRPRLGALARRHDGRPGRVAPVDRLGRRRAV